jgi:DNA-binding NarL/FixJ family response regulator
MSNNGDRRYRVLLADDHKPMLSAVQELLKAHYDVVGTACDGEATLDLVRSLAPDIAILDISMPRLNGVAAAQRLRDSGTQTKIIFLTIYSNPEFIRSAFAAGAHGYVLKRRVMTDLLLAVQAALEDRRFVSPPLTGPRP